MVVAFQRRWRDISWWMNLPVGVYEFRKIVLHDCDMHCRREVRLQVSDRLSVLADRILDRRDIPNKRCNVIEFDIIAAEFPWRRISRDVRCSLFPDLQMELPRFMREPVEIIDCDEIFARVREDVLQRE